MHPQELRTRPNRPHITTGQRLALTHATPNLTSVGRPPSFTNDDAITAATAAGLASFSVKGVAAEIGVSPAALYQRFGTRRGLLAACLASAALSVRPLTGIPDLAETLRRLSDQWWAMILRCPELDRVLYTFSDAELFPMTAPFASYRDRLFTLDLTVDQANFTESILSCNLMHLRRHLPATVLTAADVPPDVEAHRKSSLTFLLRSLCSGQPGWQVQPDSDQAVAS